MRVDDLFGRIDTARQQLQQARDETERTRKNPSEIIREYQVKVDNLPSQRYWDKEITQTEAELLDKLGFWGRQKFAWLSNGAFDEAKERYPTPARIPDHVSGEVGHYNWSNNDGHRDAFRHAYWNALLVREFGEPWAEQYATAHEAINDPPNPADQEAMDLYNNEVGRRIAMENPDVSNKEIADLIFQAVENGDMVVINSNGELVYSDEVELWEHGTANDQSVEGVIEVPNGEAQPE